MKSPRWDGRSADAVRDALTRMIDGGEAADPEPPRRRSTARLVVAIVIALLVVVPASVTAIVVAHRADPADGGMPVVAPTAPSPTPTATAARPASAGCAPTAERIPAGADRGVIDDVDGDHRPDTEWAVLLGGTVDFGITTASGATVSARAQFAGGGDRTVVVGHLANGAIVLLPSEGRTTDVLSFRDCALHVVTGINRDLPSVGSAFTLYSPEGGGDAMCLEGKLYAVSFTQTGGTEDVVGTRIAVSADGTTARYTATTRSIATAVDPASTRYTGVSCGTAPVLHPTQAP